MIESIIAETDSTPQISISRSPCEPAPWDAFVEHHPHGSVFHLTAWQRVIEKTFGHEPNHIVAYSSDGRVEGVLPLFLVRSRIFGRMLVSTPHAAYGGILASSEAARQALFQEAAVIAKARDVEFLELRGFRNVLEESSLPVKDLYV